MRWFFLITALAMNAAANVLMKIGSKSAKELAADATAFEKLFNFLNPVTLVAIFIFALNVLAYRKALDAFKLNVAYPIMVSVGMVLVIMAAWALPALKERLSWPQLVGVALIAVGLWLLTAYAGADAASAPRP